jgi:D-amino-acid dehydrogenase
MAAPTRRAVIIGGGVIGAACAYYLTRHGWHVTIVEADRFGKGCSHGNCGFVCPSHVLPLAEPGAVVSALKALVQRNSPFSIRPRFDPQLWSWLLRFAKRCNEAAMMEAGRACHALLASSMQSYRELLDTENIDCEWETRGLLFVYQTEREWLEYARTDRLLSEHFQLRARKLDGRELVQFEPALKEGLAGAWHYDGDAHLRPDRFLSSLRLVLEKGGVEIVEDCSAERFVVHQDRAVRLETARGQMTADAFVLAAGALTPRFAEQLGCPIPIQPGKGYSITMPRPSRCPRVPIIFAQHRVAVTPMRSAYRLGSTMEFAGYDKVLRTERLRLLTQAAQVYLHEPYREPFEENWFGWRPMTYDGIPIIDFSPRMSNVVIASGHSMLGVSMATGTGKLVAELVSGTAPHIDPQPYSVRRFA